MSRIAENKAKETYPEIEGSETYFDRDYICTKPIDLNRQRREGYIKGYDQAIQDMVKDSEHLQYLSDEMGYAYACGCRKTMQDFMEKACTFLKNRTMAELCLDSESTELVDDFIEDFKNYIQDESEK